MSLINAVFDGDLDEVNRLISGARFYPFHGADVNKEGKRGGTPLYIAAQKGHDNIVSALISAGADVNKAWDGFTPLYIAASLNHDSVVGILISAGADVNKTIGGGISPLFTAAQMGHDSIVSKLISAGASVDQAMEPDQFTPLMAAAHKGHDNVVGILISAGADVNKTMNRRGVTPLYIAAQEGHNSIVSGLINAGASTDNIKFFCPREYPHCEITNNSCYKVNEKNGRTWRGKSRDGCIYDFRYDSKISSPQSTSTSASNEDFNTPLFSAAYAGSGMDIGRMDGGSLKSKRRKTKRRKTKRRKTKRKTRKYK